MSSTSRVVFLLLAVVCVGVAGDAGADPEIETAGLAILNAAGDFIDVVQSVKIGEAPGAVAETGRSQKKLMRMTVPLILGFKLTGIVVAAMTALKILVLKTALMSKVAFIVSMVLAVRSLWERMKMKIHSTPYAYQGAGVHADMGWDANSAAGYEIHEMAGTAALGHQDLSHVGGDAMAAYSTAYNAAAAPAATVTLNNGTAYGFVPGIPQFIPVAERKHMRPAHHGYRSTVYKTVMREVS